MKKSRIEISVKIELDLDMIPGACDSAEWWENYLNVNSDDIIPIVQANTHYNPSTPEISVKTVKKEDPILIQIAQLADEFGNY